MLNDVDCIIIKVIEDDALSDSEVFVGIFNYWLLEVCVEFKNLNKKVEDKFHILIKKLKFFIKIQISYSNFNVEI